MSNNTIDILASINKGVQFIVEHMSPQNSSEKQISKLNRGGAELVRDNGGDAPKVELKVDSVKNIIAALNAMSPAILNIANLSGRQQKRFKNVMKTVVDVMDMMNAAGERYGDSENLNKMLDSLSKSFTIVDKVLKQMSVWTVLGPVALLGGIMAIPAFVTMGLLFKLISVMGINKDTAKAFDDMSSAFNKMTGVILKMTLITALLMGLGYILLNADTSKFILGGLIMFTGVMLATIGVMLLTGLASKLVKDFAFNALKEMMVLILGMTLIMGVFYLFGAFMDNVWETVGKGLLLFGGVCIAMLMVIGLAGLASKWITNTDGIKSLGLMYVYIFASMAVVIAAKYLADFIGSEHEKILTGLGYTGLVIAGVVAVAWIASKFKSTALKGVAAIGLVSVIAYAALGLVWAAMKLSDDAEGKWGQITITLLAVTGIITLFAGLAFAASYIAPAVIAGSVAMASLILFVASAVLSVKQIIELQKVKEEAGVSWDQVYNDVFGLSGVVGVFGILATAIGLVSPFVIAGTLACGALVLFTMGAIDITKQLITLRTHMAESGTNWNTVMSDLKSLSKVVGVLALVASAMTLALVPVTLGLAAMAMTKKFATRAIGIALSVADLGLKIKKLGGGDALVNVVKKDMKRLLGAFTYNNLKIPLGIFDIWKLRKQYNAIGGLVNRFVKVGRDISNLARIAGVVDDQGRISPVLRITDDGDVIYGEPVDIKSIAQVIVDTIKIFTSSLTDGMCSVRDMLKAGIVVHIMAGMIDPINTFMKMLTSYKSFPDGQLATITLKEDGSVQIGEPVKVVEVSQTIANTITTFINTLLSDDNVNRWTTLLYGEGTSLKDYWSAKQRRKSISVMTDILCRVVDPITKFADLLTTLDAHDDGTISRITMKDDGTIVKGPPINLVTAARTVGDVITKTLTEIFNKESLERMKSIPTIPDGTYEKIENRMTWLERISQLVTDDKKDYTKSAENAKLLGEGLFAIVNMFSTNDVLTVLSDATKTNAVIDGLTKFLNITKTVEGIKGKNVTDNAKSVVTFFNTVSPVLKSSNTYLTSFSNTIKLVKDSLYEFDKVLLDEDNKRKKAIDDFKNSMKDLLDSLKGDSGTISDLTTLISKLTNLNTSKIQDNAAEIKKALKTVSSGVDSGGSGNTGTSLSQEDVVDAIKEAMDSMRLYQSKIEKGKDTYTSYHFETDN